MLYVKLGVNPFIASCSKLLLFEGFSAIVVTARAPECQKVKIVGYTSMAV